MSSVSLASHLRVSSSWVSYAPSSWPAHAALTCAGSWAYQLFTSLHFLFVFLASSFPCCSHSPLLSRHPCFPNVYSWISLVILFPCKAPFQMFLYVKNAFDINSLWVTELGSSPLLSHSLSRLPPGGYMLKVLHLSGDNSSCFCWDVAGDASKELASAEGVKLWPAVCLLPPPPSLFLLRNTCIHTDARTHTCTHTHQIHTHVFACTYDFRSANLWLQRRRPQIEGFVW